MKLKRYLAKNMREAMDAVREELGDDAVIMSTRNTETGVEVVAAMDEDSKQNFELNSQFDLEDHSPQQVGKSVQQESQDLAMSQEIHNLSNELKTMKSMLQNQMSSLAWSQSETKDPKKVALLKKIIQLGIGWDLAENLVENVEKKSIQAWTEILKKLEDKIPVSNIDVVDAGGVVALVGPTGAGKTTTIAKMASRFVMRNSTSQLALISTDCYKIGAQAQLNTFADLLGVPVHVAATEGELYTLLSSLAKKKLILIDTAGLSQRDSLINQQPTKTRMGVDSIHNYLVMSAATQLSVMNDVVDSFGKVGLKGCILTKLDEATQLGNAVTILIEKSLPLVYTTSGQKVPEDLDAINARELIDSAMVLGQQKNPIKNEVAFKLGMGRDVSNAQ